MSTNYNLEFRETTVPNRVDLCGVNQSNVSNTETFPVLIIR